MPAELCLPRRISAELTTLKGCLLASSGSCSSRSLPRWECAPPAGASSIWSMKPLARRTFWTAGFLAGVEADLPGWGRLMLGGAQDAAPPSPAEGLPSVLAHVPQELALGGAALPLSQSSRGPSCRPIRTPCRPRRTPCRPRIRIPCRQRRTPRRYAPNLGESPPDPYRRKFLARRTLPTLFKKANVQTRLPKLTKEFPSP